MARRRYVRFNFAPRGVRSSSRLEIGEIGDGNPGQEIGERREIGDRRDVFQIIRHWKREEIAGRATLRDVLRNIDGHNTSQTRRTWKLSENVPSVPQVRPSGSVCPSGSSGSRPRCPTRTRGTLRIRLNLRGQEFARWTDLNRLEEEPVAWATCRRRVAHPFQNRKCRPPKSF
jgi:hypothetical protein